MTTQKRDAPAAPRDYRCSELCGSSVFVAGLKLLKTVNGGPEPFVAQQAHRDLHRYQWAAMRRAGGGVTLVQAVHGAVVAAGRYAERIQFIKHQGGSPDPLLLKSLGLAEKQHERLVRMLELLPADAKRDVAGELRVLKRERSQFEFEMERFVPCSVEHKAMQVGHRELLDRQMALEKLQGSQALADELREKQNVAAEQARQALATSLTGYISTVLVKRRDELLGLDPEAFVLYPKAIPVGIEQVYAEAVNVGRMVAELRGNTRGSAPASDSFFDGLDDALDVAVQSRLRLVVMERGRLQKKPIGKKPQMTEAQADAAIRAALPGE